MKKVNINGQIRNAREESFTTNQDEWNEYTLESGVTVRIKPIVQKILVLLDEQGNPNFTADGDPDVAVRHQVQVVASGGPEPPIKEEVH